MEADWDLVIKVNLKSVFNLTKAVQKYMLKQRSGSIINMSSVVGVNGNGGQSNYSASKAGLIGFTKSIAQELGSRNIRCNAIAPGYIETEMTAKLSEEVRTPVSYTHLDVYKRQLHECAGCQTFAGNERRKPHSRQGKQGNVQGYVQRIL